MPIEFSCSQCDKPLRVPDSSAGKKAKCPACGALMPVPLSSTPVAAPSKPAAAKKGPDPQAGNRVAGPAISLCAIGVLNVVYQIFNVLSVLLKLGRGVDASEYSGLAYYIGARPSIVFSMLTVGISVAIVLCAIKMKNLESYAMALLGSFLVLIPCFFPCFVLGLPLGIWSLAVLNEPGVKAAFRG